MCYWKGSAEWWCCRGLSILLANRRKPLRFRSFRSLRSQQLWQDSVRNWPCSIWPMEFVRVGRELECFAWRPVKPDGTVKCFAAQCRHIFYELLWKYLPHVCPNEVKRSYLNLIKVSSKVSHPYALFVGLVRCTRLARDDGFPSSHQLLDKFQSALHAALYSNYRSLKYKTLNSSIIYCSCCIVFSEYSVYALAILLLFIQYIYCFDII